LIRPRKTWRHGNEVWGKQADVPLSYPCRLQYLLVPRRRQPSQFLSLLQSFSLLCQGNWKAYVLYFIQFTSYPFILGTCMFCATHARRARPGQSISLRIDDCRRQGMRERHVHRRQRECWKYNAVRICPVGNGEECPGCSYKHFTVP
jgi:hypothetical protein